MTAPNANSRANLGDEFASPACAFGQMCRAAIHGRVAARALGKGSQQFQITEPELQILWCLLAAAGNEIDQTTLAAELAYSPAQMSACVEKLRMRGLIAQGEAPGDRRRRLWQLSANGSDLLRKVMQVAGDLTGRAAESSREAAA